LKSKESTRQPAERKRQDDGFKKRRGLQLRMTISYVAVSVATALLLELLLIAVFFFVILRLPVIDSNTLKAAQQIAYTYALEAAVQANGGNLDPRSTFQPGQPSSLVFPGADPTESVPYIATRSSSLQTDVFVLLIAPDGQVLASSYPALYPASTPAAHLLPGQVQLIRDALAGKAGNMVAITAQGHVLSVVQPVLDRENKPIGAIYLQMPPAFNPNGNIIPYRAILARPDKPYRRHLRRTHNAEPGASPSPPGTRHGTIRQRRLLAAGSGY